MSHRDAGWYQPIPLQRPEDNCNCGECYGCRLGQAQAKVDSAADWVTRAGKDLARAQREAEDAEAAYAAAVERRDEVQP